jgi:hypothetical protein
MKKFTYLYIIILFICCNNNSNTRNKTTVDTIDIIGDKVKLIENLTKDYIPVTLNVYEAKSNICAIFDSIISTVNNCPSLKNIQIGYGLIIQEYNPLQIYVYAIDYKLNSSLYYYSYATGLFFYKGYEFVYFGKFLDEHFMNTNEKIVRLCINALPDITGSGHIGGWEYVYKKNDNFKIIRSWIDTSYKIGGYE